MEPMKSRGPPVKLDAKALKAGEVRIIEDGFKKMIQVPLRDFFTGLPAPTPDYLGGKKTAGKRPFSMWLFHIGKADAFAEFNTEYEQYARRCGLHNVALPQGIANLVKQIIIARKTGIISFQEDEIKLQGVRSGTPGDEMLVSGVHEGREGDALKILAHFYRPFEFGEFKIGTEAVRERPPYPMPPAPAAAVQKAEQPVQPPMQKPAPVQPVAPPPLKTKGLEQEMAVGSITVMSAPIGVDSIPKPVQPPAAAPEGQAVFQIEVPVDFEAVEPAKKAPVPQPQAESQAREWKPPVEQPHAVPETDIMRLPFQQPEAAPVQKEEAKPAQVPAPAPEVPVIQVPILDANLIVPEESAPAQKPADARKPVASPPAVQQPPPATEEVIKAATTLEEINAARAALRQKTGSSATVQPPAPVQKPAEKPVPVPAPKPVSDQDAAWIIPPGPKLGVGATKDAMEFEARITGTLGDEKPPAEPIKGPVYMKPAPAPIRSEIPGAAQKMEAPPKPEPAYVPAEEKPLKPMSASRERPTFMQKLNAPIHISPTAAKYMKRGAFLAAGAAVVALSVIGVRDYMKPVPAPAPLAAKALKLKPISIPIAKTPVEEVKPQEEQKPVVAKAEPKKATPKAKRAKSRLGREMEPIPGETVASRTTPTFYETPTEEAYSIVVELLTGRNYENELRAIIKGNPEYAAIYDYINRVFKDNVIDADVYMTKVQSYKPPIFAGVVRDIRKGMDPKVIMARVEKTVPYVPDGFKNKD